MVAGVGGVQRWARELVQVLYPRVCLCCGQTLLFRSALPFPICPGCAAQLQPIECGSRCQICSAPLISEWKRCTRCVQRNFSFTANFSRFEYRAGARRILSQFKFSGRRSLAPLIASLLAPPLRRLYPGLPVVPVPGSRRSVRRRGWDPMVEVARAMRRSAEVEVLALLRRDRGSPQKGLRYSERLANIRGTIRLRGARSKRARISGGIVLLDDIFTTGATADECSRILLGCGADEVYVLTLAMEL